MKTAMLYIIFTISTIQIAYASKSPSDDLIGWWKLQTDCDDSSKFANHGINHNIEFINNSAKLNGTNSYIEIPADKSLNLGSSDFSISVWVKCESGARIAGDILSKFRKENRTGLNINIPVNASGHNSASDTRNLFFGIDAGIDSEWEDIGRPVDSNSLISVLITYKNCLYAGIANASDPKDACRMFRYDGGKKWTDCGRVSDDINTPSIYSAIVHNGVLYAGTGMWDYANLPAGGKAEVFRYMGNKRWDKCGSFSSGKRILTLASVDGKLFGTDDTGASYRRESDDNWVYIGSSVSYKYCGAMVYQDKLYAGASTTIDRYNGRDGWDNVGKFDIQHINQIYAFTVYRGKLYVGTWPDGSMMRFDFDGVWTDCGWVGSPDRTNLGLGYESSMINEINSFIVYNGRLYSGVIPKGEVWRYEEGQKHTLIKNLANNPEYHVTKHDSWCRVPCMTIYKGYLYAGTSSARGIAIENQTIDTGKIFRWKTGECVSYDDDIGTDWRHITAIREGNILRIYIDGKLEAESAEDKPLFDISNNEPLLIGFGESNYFKGDIKDVRIYSTALSAEDINRIYAEREKTEGENE